MARIACPVGIDDAGNRYAIGEDLKMVKIPGTQGCIDLLKVIRDRGGDLEVKIVDIHCLATATAGGELKPRHRFTKGNIEAHKRQAEARKKGDIEAEAQAKAKADAVKKEAKAKAGAVKASKKKAE